MSKRLATLHRPLPPEQPSGQLTDVTYDRLREMITSNRLRSGERLADRALGEQLGVSRTPVREALARLVATGLVVVAPDRGYRVAEVDMEAVRELYEFRTVLEVEAAKLACARAVPADLDELRDVLALTADLRGKPGRRPEEVRVG